MEAEADVLSQDEVDALLTGVEDVSPSVVPPEASAVADDGEIDPWLTGFSEPTGASPESTTEAAGEATQAGATRISHAPAEPVGELEIDPWLQGFTDIVEAETQAHEAAVAAASSTASAGSNAASSAAGGAFNAAPTARGNLEQLVVTATLTHADLAQAAQLEALKLPALERIAENLLKPLTRELRRFLRRDLEVAGEPVSFGQWQQAAAGAGDARLLRMTMAPLPGEAVVAIDNTLVDTLVEYLFGSEGRYYRPPGEPLRAPGHTGTRIAARLLEHLMIAWQRAWEPVYAIAPAAAGIVVDPTLFAAPDDAVFGLALKATLGERGGQMRILLPLTLLQPVHERLRSGYTAPPAPPASGWSQRMLDGIGEAEIELTADLGSTELTLKQVLAMQAGDFIPLVVPPTVIATADHEPLLECQYGVSAGRYALRVERVLVLPQPESGGSHV